jgi:predicted nuclease with TOPRIM domain
MINNIDIIKPLLTFDNEGEFYMLYIFKRKKDQTIDKANHQSVRTIKSYCIESIEQLEKRYDEIIQLCEMFKARAYIHIQKQNHKDVAMNMITEIVTRIQSGQINQKHVFDSVVGQIKTQEKRWIVDIDDVELYDLKPIMDFIDTLRPEGLKVESIIPTKNGYHLITKRFDVMEFKKKYPEIDIQKKNPTLLYYPNSINN